MYTDLKVMKFSYLAVAAILCCLGYIYCYLPPVCTQGSGYVYLFKGSERIEEGESIVYFVIAGFPSAISEPKLKEVEKVVLEDGEHFVAEGEYRVQDCPGVVLHVMVQMMSNHEEWHPFQIDGYLIYILVEETNQNSFVQFFHGILKSMGTKVPSRGRD